MLYTKSESQGQEMHGNFCPGAAAPEQNSVNSGVAPAPTGATKTPTPADFPRVSGTEQKGRDSDRRE